MKFNSVILSLIAIGFLFISSTTSACYQYSGKTLQKKAYRFDKAIKSASRKYNVSPSLIKAVITVESCFNPRARGTSGEKGLMQIMPGTARFLGIKSNYNSWSNIHGGTKYLKYLLKRFNGNKRYAAAAYNGGPGAVSKKHGPRFNQVRRYSNKVMKAYRKISARTPYKKSRSRKAKKSKARKASRKYSRNKYKSKRSKKRSRKRTKTYRIRKGDSLSTISHKTGISVKRLKRLNRLKSSRIKTGKRLKLRK